MLSRDSWIAGYAQEKHPGLQEMVLIMYNLDIIHNMYHLQCGSTLKESTSNYIEEADTDNAYNHSTLDFISLGTSSISSEPFSLPINIIHSTILQVYNQ